MKKHSILWCSMLLAAFTVGCQTERTEGEPGIEVSEASLKSSGTAFVQLANIADTTQTTWSIDPSETARIIASGSSAYIVFSKKGHYTLTATNGSHTFATHIRVDSLPNGCGDTIRLDDSLYIPHDTIPFDTIPPVVPDTLPGNDTIVGNGYVSIPIANDVLYLTPESVIDSMGVKGLRFTVRTQKQYPCRGSYVAVAASVQGDSVSVYSNYVQSPKNCRDGYYQALGRFNVFPLREGAHALNVTVSGVRYSGTLVNQNGRMTIVWRYTNGVIFTSKVL